jgi:hypothetical protein
MIWTFKLSGITEEFETKDYPRTPCSILAEAIENFINSEVVVVNSKGHSPQGE